MIVDEQTSNLSVNYCYQWITVLYFSYLSLDPIYQSVCSWNVYLVKKKNHCVQWIVVSFCRRILIVCLCYWMLAFLGAFQKFSWFCPRKICSGQPSCPNVAVYRTATCDIQKITINKKIEMTCFVFCVISPVVKQLQLLVKNNGVYLRLYPTSLQFWSLLLY